MTLKSTSFSTAAAVAPSENQSMQPRKRGRKPKPVVEFPQAVISEWTDVPCFHEAFALHLERHADSIGHLHKALSYIGAKIERSTFVQWAAGKKAQTSLKSIAILAMIERRYRLPAGYFKAKLTNNMRAASGHTRLSGVTRSERRRLAWHLPDDFDDRSARERQEILQWVRSVIISGTTDYRRYQAEAAKHRFAIRFPSLTHRRRLRDFDPANEGEIQSADEADLELAVARADAPPAFVQSWIDRCAAVQAGGMEAIADSTIERWLSPDFRKREAEVTRSVRDMIIKTDAVGYQGCAAALSKLDYLRHLGQIALPVSYVVGSDDSGAPVEVMEDMARRTASSTFDIIQGAAHLPNIDSEDAFNRLLTARLTEFAR